MIADLASIVMSAKSGVSVIRSVTTLTITTKMEIIDAVVLKDTN